jgi:thiopeptide-type bacteriocin biosynthesis protein
MSSSEQLCLFALLYAPREQHERIISELMTPIAREVRDAPELDSLFFARYNVPSWQLRFRILGRPDWISGPVRERVRQGVAPLQAAGTVDSVEFAEYDRELERYGGEEGMALAEQLFLHDSLAILDLIEADRQGLLEKSRREISLLMTERLLDLLHFDRAQRTAFYAYGYQWTREMATWRDEDLDKIEQRYGELQPGLQGLFTGERRGDPAWLWGGASAARIAGRWLEASRPVAEAIRAAHAAGRIRQSLEILAWSYAHMSCNRFGIDSTPEAILRYFMHRLYEDGGGSPEGS